MQSESREEKRRGQLLVTLHVVGLAVLAGACIIATAGAPGGADRHVGSSAAAPVAGAAAPAAAPAGVAARHRPSAKG